MNEELENVISEKKLLYQRQLNTNDPEDRRAYTRFRAEVKKQVSETKHYLWFKVCEKADNSIGTGSMSRIAWLFGKLHIFFT